MQWGGRSPPCWVYFYMTTTSLKNKHNSSFLGFQPLSDSVWKSSLRTGKKLGPDQTWTDHDRKWSKAVRTEDHSLVFSPLPALKMSTTTHSRVFNHSLIITSPEYKHNCSFLGFNLSDNHQPWEQAQALVLGVSTTLWHPTALIMSTTTCFWCKYIYI